MARITTVLGDIAPEELGFTTMHDHTVSDITANGEYMAALFPELTQEMVEFKLENYPILKTGAYLANKDYWILEDVDALAKELGFFSAIGGNAIVDPDPISLRGDIKKIRLLSEKTGLHIICATGMYHEMAIPKKYHDRDEEFFYNLFKDEIENGIDGTDIHPGILKASLATASKNEEAVLGACLRLTKETGMVTYVHTHVPLDDDSILNMLESVVEKYDVDRSRINVCHMDSRLANSVEVNDYLFNPEVNRTIDLALPKILLEKGYNIGLDGWGTAVEPPNCFMPDDFDRLKALITLIDMGYGKQITLGDDFGDIITYRAHGGYGCTRFAEFGLYMLSQLGREDDVKMLAYENPARILAY